MTSGNSHSKERGSKVIQQNMALQWQGIKDLIKEESMHMLR